MAPSDADTPTVSALQAEVGTDLRSVIRYAEDDYDIAFFRDDVGAISDAEEITAVLDDPRLQGWDHDYVAEVFTVGDRRCAAFAFEDAMVLVFGQTDFEGVLATSEGRWRRPRRLHLHLRSASLLSRLDSCQERTLAMEHLRQATGSTRSDG